MMKRVREATARTLSIEYPLAREAIAEFVGTAMLIAMGDGCVAQSVLSRGTGGAILSINIGWGLAVMLGVLLAGGVSGGHLNPAISLANWFLGAITSSQLLVFQLAQYAGAIFGSAIVYTVYYDALEAYDGGVRMVSGPNATAGIWSTYPQPFLTLSGGIIDQVFGTCVLAVAVMSICDPRNMSVPKPLIPFLVCLLVKLVNWGRECFSYRNYRWFWIPVLGPYIGGTLGAGVYHLTVAIHWPKTSPKNSSEDSSPSVSAPLVTALHVKPRQASDSASPVAFICDPNLTYGNEEVLDNDILAAQGLAIALLYVSYCSFKWSCS